MLNSARPGQLLIVDDDPLHCQLLIAFGSALGYTCIGAQSGQQAIEALTEDTDLVLLDARMPELSGFEVARQIRAHPIAGEVPIIMVTASSQTEDRVLAIEAGANDFFTKPIDRVEFQVRTGTLIEMKRAQAAVKEHVNSIERRSSALFDVAEALHRLASVRDPATALHMEDVGNLSMRVARVMGLPDEQIKLIGTAGKLHDIGKMCIRDAVLYSDRRLTVDEWADIHRHPAIGGELIASMPGLEFAAEAVRSHHERWDGGGYPDGLLADEIPLAARILCAVDAFSAMTHDRNYQPARERQWALAELRRNAGTQFDPAVIDACEVALSDGFESEATAASDVSLDAGEIALSVSSAV